MHQNSTYTDLVDRYLKGKLSQSEQLAFEDKMRQDPLLAHEISWQKDIYQVLGETRRVALKNRLDQVPVHTTPWMAWSGSKVAATVGALLVAGTGFYYYFSPLGDPANAIDNSLPTTPSVVYPRAYTLRHAPPAVAPRVNLPEASVAVPPAVASSEKVPVPDQSKTKPTLAEVRPTIVRPDVVSEFAEDTSVDYSDFAPPEKQTLQRNNYREEDVAIETLTDSQYDFHYQFYNNKLFLHGNFRGLPYKIIALNTEVDKKLFLEFNHTYYRIKKRKKVAPLVAIEDSTLVNSLQELEQVK